MSAGLAAFTIFHVAISLIAILSGFVVMFGLLAGRLLRGWTALFLITTIATSVTGFMFPRHGFTPGQAVGILSLAVLGIALLALYGRRLAGAWRLIFVVTAMTAFYFNFFVLVAQSFEKIPALNAIAPTQSAAPFKVTQLCVLLAFIVITIAAAIKYHPGGRPPAGIAGVT